MSHLSTSALMASYLSKTQVNNFMNHTPTKSHYLQANETTKDFSIKPVSQYSPNAFKYSPELDSFRREVNDQIRNVVYSLTSEMKVMRKENSEYRFQIDELRREVESANSKILQYKASYNAEMLVLKNNIIAGNEPENMKHDDVLKNNWTKNDNKRKYGDSTEINDLNMKMSQISRQVHSLNEELDLIKKFNYVPREQFSRSLVDIVDELERKLSIINDRVKERIEEMDASMVEALKDKNQDVQKLHYDIRNIQSSVIRVSDQVNTYTHSHEVNLEDQVKKIMTNYSVELRNISSLANTTEQKLKMMKKEEISSPLLNSSFQPSYHNDEIKAKLKELDSIYQSVALLEKEVRSKTDMVDLNINSIKRNLELELSIQLKHMVLPIQKSVEQYLQTSEGRFTALEDAVLNHMKRDSYVMTAERASRFRNSNMMDDIPYTRPVFENISSIDPTMEERMMERKSSQPELRSGPGSRTALREKSKERQSQETFKIEEVDSVVSMSDVLRSTWKNGDKEKFGDLKMEHLNVQETEENERNIDQRENTQNNEEENNEPLNTIAKRVVPDKDKNKKQKDPEEKYAKNEPSSQPDSMFRDFPSTSAMKAHLDLEKQDQKKPAERSSSKKKRPEIEVNEISKDTSKEKKLTMKNSPINLDSKLILNSEGFAADDDITPPTHTRGGREKERPKSKEPVQVESEEEIPQEFHGNIKGLLRKSRNMKDKTPSLEELDSERGRPKSPLKGRYEEPKPSYGNERGNSSSKKSPLPTNKGLDKQPLGKAPLTNPNNQKNSQKALPPVDNKGVKNFNKGQKELPPPRPQSGRGYGNQPMYGQNQGFYGGGYNNGDGWGQQGEEEGESVEEVVYHVDEEGFLVDEAGNYLVDEQGNFLQLSPDQMKEIEEKDLVYEKEF